MATTANLATAFTGSLSGDVTGYQSTTSVATVGGITAAIVGAGANAAYYATPANTVNKIVSRDGSGNFSANVITAVTNFSGNLTGNVTGNLTGLASNASTAVNFSASLSGDVTGTQGATMVGAWLIM